MTQITRNLSTRALRGTPRVHATPAPIPALDVATVETFRASMPLARTLAWLGADMDRSFARDVATLTSATGRAVPLPLSIRVAIVGGIGSVGVALATLMGA